MEGKETLFILQEMNMRNIVIASRNSFWSGKGHDPPWLWLLSFGLVDVKSKFLYFVIFLSHWFLTHPLALLGAVNMLFPFVYQNGLRTPKRYRIKIDHTPKTTT